ncbi:MULTISPECIES: hypothetical protein [unclassified Streptomyces]|uniref:DUF7848 domain-containing protein n=1 Tax=unclassified Streptomyces TaxID=2593676 RepID=UPI00278C465F|nr:MULTISPECIES: hypothetical protein [unclassified Streptomyces]
MPKSVITMATWLLSPDREPDAEPLTRKMVCVVCLEDGTPECESPPYEDGVDGVLAAQEWVFRHVGHHPVHHTYREIITRPWRAVMTQ